MSLFARIINAKKLNHPLFQKFLHTRDKRPRPNHTNIVENSDIPCYLPTTSLLQPNVFQPLEDTPNMTASSLARAYPLQGIQPRPEIRQRVHKRLLLLRRRRFPLLRRRYLARSVQPDHLLIHLYPQLGQHLIRDVVRLLLDVALVERVRQRVVHHLLLHVRHLVLPGEFCHRLPQFLRIHDVVRVRQRRRDVPHRRDHGNLRRHRRRLHAHAAQLRLRLVHLLLLLSYLHELPGLRLEGRVRVGVHARGTGSGLDLLKELLLLPVEVAYVAVHLALVGADGGFGLLLGGLGLLAGRGLLFEQVHG
mmetsp:Transcript_19157/g.46001  ORF Transcript_19157/g.46001 Transcript_19157/m.46001 type:complete len:306 (-) Transcript_19157:58-975(-)